MTSDSCVLDDGAKEALRWTDETAVVVRHSARDHVNKRTDDLLDQIGSLLCGDGHPTILHPTILLAFHWVGWEDRALFGETRPSLNVATYPAPSGMARDSRMWTTRYKAFNFGYVRTLLPRKSSSGYANGACIRTSGRRDHGRKLPFRACDRQR